MPDFLQSIPRVEYPLVIAILFGIHEFEEWNILDWYKRHYVDLPPSTKFSIRLHILVLSVAAIGLMLIARALYSTPAFGWIIAAFSLFIAVNSIQHVIWSFQTRSYSPGLASGLLLLSATAAMNVVLASEGLIAPASYLMALLALPPLVDTLRSGNRMTKAVLAVHRFFIRAETLLKRSRDGA